MMPTVFVDQRLRPWTAVTPTATRVFPEGDVLTVIVPHASATPVNGRLTNGDGAIVWEGTGTGVAGAPAVQLIVPLDHVGTAVCDLTIESREGQVRTTIGLVPSKGGPR
jgi:hypothetical protein